MRVISEEKFIKEYISVIPRPEIKFFDNHIESFIWERIDRPNALPGIKKVEVEVKINDVSDFVSQISYASEKYGKEQFAQKCLVTLTSIVDENDYVV